MLRTISRVVIVAIAVMSIPPPASWAGNVLEFVEAEFDGVGGVDGLNAAYAVTVSPDGAHVYVAGHDDDAVAIFQRDGLTGALTFVEAEFDGVGGVDGLNGPSSVAVSPDSAHVYVASRNDNAVAVFERDGVTGALTFVEAQFNGVGGVHGLFSARSVVVSADGMHVYVAAVLDDSVAVFERDGVTGALTFAEAQFDGVGGVDGLDGAYSVAVSADGAHVYVAGYVDDAVTVFERDSVTGALTFGETEFDGVDGVDGLNGARSVAVSPDGGNVYVAGYEDDAVTVWDRDSVTGALTFVEAQIDGIYGVDGLNAASSVAVSADGGHVYVASYYDDSVAVFERDGVTGELTFVEAHFDGIDGVDGLDGPYAVAVSPDGGNVYAASWNEDALSVFVRGLLDPVVVADLEAGNEAYFAHDFVTAEQHFNDVISAMAQWAPGFNNRGLARCKQLDFAGAGADFDMAKSLAPTYVAPFLNQGKCLAMQKDFAAARTEFEAGLAIDPQHAKLLYNLGWVEAEEGHYVDAIARYSEALAEDPTYVRARVAAGVALAENGERGSAVVAFYDAINMAPTGDLFAAMSAYNLQLLRGPGVSFDSEGAAQAYVDGLFNMRVGLFAQAEQDFIDAKMMEPFVPDIPWMLAWCRLRLLQTDSAADAHADALPLMPLLDIASSEESQLFIDGIVRGNTPQTVEVFPSRVDVAFRRAQGPQERTVPAYADGTPGGESPIEVTLDDVSTLSPFAAVNDTDRDWLGDDWEVSSFGDLSQDPWGDWDGDLVSNLREYWANSDPGSVLVTVEALDESAGEPSDTGEFRISRTGPTTSAMTVYYSVGGTATNGSDYTSISPTSTTIDAGQAHRDIVISPIDDSLIEGTETVVMTLTADAAYTIGTPGDATVSITDDDVAPTLSIDDVTVTEGDVGTADAVFTVTLSATSGQEVTVDYSTADGTATAGVDYVAGAGTLTFIAGDTEETVTVVVNGDTLDELDETFFVNLSNPANATISDGQGQGTITDDENPLIVVKKQTIPAGDPAVFTFMGDVAGAIGGGQHLLLNPTPGTYTSTEVVPIGWSLFKCKCDDTDSVGDMATATATIELGADESVTCVFTNCADSVAPTLDLSGVTVSSTEMYEACDTLTADSFTIESTGEVSFRAGSRIVLKDGFSVASGGNFTAEIVGEP